MSSIYQRALAELFGTFWLVLGGCGAVVLLGPQIGPLGIALAFGLVVLTLSYAIGHISGCHINPAVTVGLWVGNRFPTNEILPYVLAQVVGGVIGAAVLYFIARGSGMDMGSFAANGFADHSPGKFNMMTCFFTEAVVTFMFIFIFLNATSARAPAGFGPLAIGLAFTSMHFVALSVTGAGLNPARSLATAVFAGEWAINQLWLFWVAPLIGAVLAGLLAGDRHKGI